METQGQRIKKIRMALNLSQNEFGKIFDISKQFVSLIENDKTELNNDKLVKLLLDYNVNINYLLGGFNEMFINECENTHLLRKSEKPALNFKNWGKRLGKILAENEETPLSFAKRTGIKESRIEKFVLDSIEPTIEELNKIKENVDVSIDELLYGETVTEKAQTENICLSPEEILKIKKLISKS